MTKKEAKRLLQFVKEHGDSEINSHIWLIKQDNSFVSPKGEEHVYIKDCVNKFYLLNIPFKHIKKVSLWIQTSYGVYYF